MINISESLDNLERLEDEGIDLYSRITNDIHDFAPMVGETIACDVRGDGRFDEYRLTMVGKHTFWAVCDANGSDELKLTCRFGTRRSHRAFWRGPYSRTLHYQYTKEDI